MLKLIPEKVDFRISTTDLLASYTESKGVTIRLDVQTIQDQQQDRYSELELVFDTVAELRCVTVNFFEYIEHEIRQPVGSDQVLSFWQQHGYHPDSGLYEVDASEQLLYKQSLFDPRGRLGLKHYVIIGYDSYIEIIAAGYTYRFITTT